MTKERDDVRLVIILEPPAADIWSLTHKRIERILSDEEEHPEPRPS